MARIPGYYGNVGVDAVKQLALQGQLRTTVKGGFGLYSAELVYRGQSQDGTMRDDLFAFKCYHGHKTRRAAQSCATQKLKQLRQETQAVRQSMP